MTRNTKLKLTEPILVHFEQMIADRLGNFEYEISKSLGPEIADAIIARLRKLEDALSNEFDRLDKKIEVIKRKQSDTKPKKGTLDLKLATYFDTELPKSPSKFKKTKETSVKGKGDIGLGINYKTFMRNRKNSIYIIAIFLHTHSHKKIIFRLSNKIRHTVCDSA